jgi:hypothetical protein
VLLRGATPATQPIQPIVRVLQDDAPLPRENAGPDVRYNEAGEALVIPDRPRMYQLVNNPDFESHELKLVIEGKGFAAYAASFTTCVARSVGQ